jgi:carbonic anhydrase/acetyltransferase-like protein (isoleucine patch superfamily)
MKDIFYIFGHISTAIEISETIAESLPGRFMKVFFVVSDHDKLSLPGENYVSDSCLREHADKNRTEKAYYIVSVLDPAIKRKCVSLAEGLGIIPHSIISHRAYISPTARTGKGTYIAPLAALSSGATVKDHVIINYNAVIGHDAMISDHCNISPGASIGGTVRIGKRTIIGSNAFIYQGVTIGNDCVVDALTHVFQDVLPDHICSSRNTRILKRVL